LGRLVIIVIIIIIIIIIIICPAYILPAYDSAKWSFLANIECSAGRLLSCVLAHAVSESLMQFQ